MHRVVVTGLGIVAPNGENVEKFLKSLKEGKSGIKYHKNLDELNYRCKVAGVPQVNKNILEKYLSKGDLRGLKSTAVVYAIISAIEAYHDAGFVIDKENVDWDFGCVYGCSSPDHQLIKEAISFVDGGNPRAMGSRYVSQTMASGSSAYMSKLFGLGNHVFSNSSACSTGTESLLLAYEKIKNGTAKRMLAGSCEPTSIYTWGSFDAMRVLSSLYPDQPEKASRPMSKTAGGFVPGSGAATLILENMELAKKRGAKIYAEIIGGAVNCGGQREGGSMTAPNNAGVKKCIIDTLKNSNISASDVDLISGHLTATMADVIEIKNWSEALGRSQMDFPYINSLKSLTGHCLSAAGSIETVSAILQLHNSFIFPNSNCEDLNQDIENIIDKKKIPQTLLEENINIVLKANFGFGDVNSCIALKKVILN